MFTFIHAADIHLDSPLRGLERYEGAPVAEIRGATRRAFEALVDLAIEEAVTFLLVAGDVYDGDWKDYNTGLYFARLMGRLDSAGIRVFIVSGNHDAASRITRAMPLPGNVTVFSSKKPESVKLLDLGAAIHGQSYATQVVTDNLAAAFPPGEPGCFNIGLLHTSLTGRPGHEAYAPCSVALLQEKGYDYWALGHVHRREIVGREPWIVFPGNIQGRHIRENGAKGVTLVMVEEGRVARVEERSLDVLRWEECRVDVSDCQDVDAVYAAVRQALRREKEAAEGRSLALRLHLTGDCPVHAGLMARMAELTEEFRGIAVGLGELWLEQVHFQTRRKVDLETVLAGDTPLAGLLKTLHELDLGPDSLFNLMPELRVLKSKLPVEVESGGEALLAFSSETAAQLQGDVRELLVARLLQSGGES